MKHTVRMSHQTNSTLAVFAIECLLFPFPLLYAMSKCLYYVFSWGQGDLTTTTTTQKHHISSCLLLFLIFGAMQSCQMWMMWQTTELWVFFFSFFFFMIRYPQPHKLEWCSELKSVGWCRLRLDPRGVIAPPESQKRFGSAACWTDHIVLTATPANGRNKNCFTADIVLKAPILLVDTPDSSDGEISSQSGFNHSQYQVCSSGLSCF